MTKRVMNNKYLKYSLEDFLEDKQFVGWILKGHQNEEWSTFVNDYPEIHSKVKEAEEIILLLKDKYDILDEEEVLLLWHNIDRFNRSYKKKARTVQLRRTITVAASVLIVISLGILEYSYWNNQNLEYQFSSSNIPNGGDNARLVLSDGEQIDLENDKSTISIDNKEKITINNESVIDLSENEENAIDDTRMNEVIVPYGKSSELLLADGTKVWLNAGSRLAFPTKFTKSTREVYLEGEACFKVAKNESQPFIVNANDLGIKVLGTHFNVSAYANEDNIETVLVEGSVVVGKKTTFGISKNSLELEPYQKATFNKEEKEIIISDEPEAENYIAWTEGWLNFSNEKLENVLTKVGRFYDVTFEYDIEKIKLTLPISGKLDLKESFEEVMSTLSKVSNFEYEIENDKVIIK